MAGPHLYTVDSKGSVDQHKIYSLFALYLTLLAKWSPILGENLTVLPQTTAFPGFDALKRKHVRSHNTIPVQCTCTGIKRTLDYMLYIFYG